MNRYLKDRYLDSVEWFDFRPDPALWPLSLLPVLAICGYLWGGTVFAAVAVVALAAAVAFSLFALCAIFLKVVVQAVVDFFRFEKPLSISEVDRSLFPKNRGYSPWTSSNQAR